MPLRQDIYGGVVSAVPDMPTPQVSELEKGAITGASSYGIGDAAEQVNADRIAGRDPTSSLRRLSQLQAEAALYTPRVSRFDQIHGAGDAADYFAAKLGELGPSIAPIAVGGLLGRAALGGTGGGVLRNLPGINHLGEVGALGGTAAAIYPTERNTGILEAESDPANADLDPQLIRDTAAKRAAINTIAGSIVPYGANKAFFSKGISNPTAALTKAAGENALLTAAQAKVGQHYASELNPNRDQSQDDLNTIDAAITGGVAGGLFHAPASARDALAGPAAQAADLAAEKAPGAYNAVKNVFNSATDKAKPGVDSALEALRAKYGDASAHLKARLGGDGDQPEVRDAADTGEGLKQADANRIQETGQTDPAAQNAAYSQKVTEFVKQAGAVGYKQAEGLATGGANILSRAKKGLLKFLGNEGDSPAHNDEQVPGAPLSLNRRAELSKLVFENLDPIGQETARQNPGMVKDWVRAIHDLTQISGHVDEDALPDLSLVRGALNLVSDPTAFVKAVEGKSSGKTILSTALKASAAADDASNPDSMLRKTIRPELQAEASSIAKKIDQASLSDRSIPALVNYFGDAFPDAETAKTVLSTYRNLNDQRIGLREPAKPTESPAARLTDTKPEDIEKAARTDNEAEVQNPSEEKATYTLDNPSEGLPFEKGAHPDLDVHGQRFSPDAQHEVISYRQYLEETGQNKAKAVEYLKNALQKQKDANSPGKGGSPGQVERAAAKHAGAVRQLRNIDAAESAGGVDQALEQHSVVKTSGRPADHLVATDDDLAAYSQIARTGDDKTRFVVKDGAGKEHAFSAESVIARQGVKEKDADVRAGNESDKARRERLFKDGLASILANDRFKGGKLTTPLSEIQLTRKSAPLREPRVTSEGEVVRPRSEKEAVAKEKLNKAVDVEHAARKQGLDEFLQHQVDQHAENLVADPQDTSARERVETLENRLRIARDAERSGDNRPIRVEKLRRELDAVRRAKDEMHQQELDVRDDQERQEPSESKQAEKPRQFDEVSGQALGSNASDAESVSQKLRADAEKLQAGRTKEARAKAAAESEAAQAKRFEGYKEDFNSAESKEVSARATQLFGDTHAATLKAAESGSLRTTLESIKGDKKSTGFAKLLANRVLRNLVKEDVKVVVDPNFEGIAQYNTATKTIVINPAGTRVTKSLMHEAIHAVTERAIAKNEALRGELLEIFEHTNRNTAAWNKYGAKNIYEFTAEVMTNPEFQTLLSNAPATRPISGFTNLLQQFFRAIGKALGIDVKDNSLLAQALDVTDRIIKADNRLKADDATRAKFSDSVKKITDPTRVAALIQRYEMALKNYVTENTPKNQELVAAGKMTPEEAMESPGARVALSKFLAESDIPYKLDALRTRARELSPSESAQPSLETTKVATEPTKEELGKTVEAAGAKIKEEIGPEVAGIKPETVVELGVHATDPRTEGFDNALLKFFDELGGSKESRALKQQLKNIGGSGIMRAQLEKLGIKTDGPLDTVSKAFQVWAADPTAIRLGPETKTLFQKIAAWVRKALGVMTGEEKIEAVFRGLKAGDFTNINAVHKILIERNAELASEKLARWTGQMGEQIHKLWYNAHERLKGFNSEALNAIAEAFQPTVGSDAEDGKLGLFADKARMSTHFENKLSDALNGIDQKTMGQILADGQGMIPHTTEAGKKVKAILDEMWQYMHDAGVKVPHQTKDGNITWESIGKQPNYFPRAWDIEKIENNLKEFRSLFGPHLGVDQTEAFLSKMRQGSGAVDMNEESSSLSPFNASINKRAFDFIGPNNAKDFARFQKNDLHEILGTYLREGVHRAEHTRYMGVNGEKITKALEQAGREGLSEKELEDARTTIAGLDGTLRPNMNPTLRNVFAGAVTYQNVVLLPYSLLSSLVDPLGTALRTGDLGDAWEGFKEGMKGVYEQMRGKPAGEREQLVRDLNIIGQQTMLDSLGSQLGVGKAGRQFRAINNWFFRWNGMDEWNKRMRIAATFSGMRYLLKNAGDETVRNELGLKEGDIKAHEDRMAINEHEGLSAAQAERVRLALYRFVDSSILRPNAAHRPVWGSDPLYQTVFHLKQFTFSFQNVILKRANQRMRAGDARPAMILASYVPLMMGIDAVRTIMSGGLGSLSSVPSQVVQATLRSGIGGLATFAGDAGYDAVNGSVPGASLLGPTANHIGFMLRTMFGSTSGHDLLMRSLPLSPALKPVLND